MAIQLIPRQLNRPAPMRTSARLSGLVALATGFFFCLVPAIAQAAPVDFTIGIPGKTGCLVCHGDPKLTEVKSKKVLYISESVMLGSVHKDVPCTKCHTDFDSAMATQSHQGKNTDSKKIAGLSCKNCHEHAAQLKVYDKSTHGRLAMGGDDKAPTCADCHGSHEIKSLKKNKAYRAEFRMNAKQVCGKCHQKYYASYNDYYHGRAYKTGAADAPACWDCHGAHEILPADQTESKVAKGNLAKTCGTCHPDSRAGFANFGALIHGRDTMLGKNLLIKYKDKLLTWFGDTFLGSKEAAASGKPAAAKP